MGWAVDGYEPVAEVGRGETGLVLRARETATGADVAIRYLPRSLHRAPAFMDRYRREVEALRLIDHPNVAAVYGLVERREAATVVTEFVDGVSLRELLRHTGPLAPTAALYVIYSVQLALVEMHDRGIVHRALRPENILIDAGGTAKVVDVGLARPGSEGLPANPVYAAPELWFGDEPTPSADVFAATAILYECLSGSPPRGASGAYLGRSGQSPDAATATLGPDLAGSQVGAYIAHGLATEPVSRLDGARAAAGQLNAVAAATFGAGWYGAGQTMLQRDMATRLSPVGAHAPRHAADSLTDEGDSRLPFRAPVWTTDEPAWWLAAERDEWQPPDPLPDRAPRPNGGPPPNGGRSNGAPPNGGPNGVRANGAPPPETAGRLVERDHGPGPSGQWEPDPQPLVIPDGQSHRAGSGKGRALVTAGVIIVVAAVATLGMIALIWPHNSASGSGPGGSSPVATGSTATAPPTSVPNDAAGPAAPTGLRVTGRSVSGVSLDWAAATDNVGIKGYLVLRDGVRVGTTVEPGYTDRGLTADTGYTYTVTAFDAAGNASDPSASVKVTTLKYPDDLRPSAPTGLAVTNTTADRVTLTWAPARDNIGVAGYRVYRDGRMIANVSRPGFADTGLTADTSYEYKVQAFDTSNNISANSSTVTGTTRPQSTTSPPTATEPPATDPTIESVSVTSLLSGCTVAVEATAVASAPMHTDLMYTVDGESGAKPLRFTAHNLTQVVSLGTFVDNDGGAAMVRVGDRFDVVNWPTCDG
jgi:serine/threonine protein kinase/chitodextrinase